MMDGRISVEALAILILATVIVAWLLGWLAGRLSKPDRVGRELDELYREAWTHPDIDERVPYHPGSAEWVRRQPGYPSKVPLDKSGESE